ncbi:MAG: hypothetical protein JXA81_00135 [Sedimentisphaerales bacterium]|nr:hypothetical protein [Sedimentisphaerales bacterium]
MSDTKNDSRNLPECIGEYVRRLLKKMRYRRKIRNDVEAELTAHFEDELKDCKTTEEKEQKAKQLLSDFGDLKLLAILLRRAKKRCRPLWRTVIARTFQAICVLIVCFIFYAIWFSFGEPTIRVDYIQLFNQINRPKILNQDNAWPHYEKAFELFVPRSPVVEQFISYRESRKERKDALRLQHLIQDNAQQIKTWLDKNQHYWDNLSTEQQEVLLKCLEYNSIPFPKIVYQSNNDWRTTTIELMTEHIIRCINEETQITTPRDFGTLRSSLGSEYLRAELNNWLKNKTIPPSILDAVSVAALHEAIKRFKNLPEDISAPLTDVECEYIGGWIKQNEAAWREFVAGSTKSYCYRPIAHDADDQDKSLWSIAMPPLNMLKDLARLGAWRCRIDRTEGRLQQSIENCIAVARAGGHWQGKGTIVEQLVGQAISGLGHGEILTILADEKLTADQLRYLQEQLSKIYPGDYPLMNMEGERLTFMDVIQHSFTDGGPGGGHLIPGLWDKYTDTTTPFGYDESEKRILLPLYTAISMAHARRDATVAKANEIYDLQSKITRMTPYERHVSNIKAVDEYESLHNYRFFLIQMFMPATARASEIAYRGKMGHEATKTIIAILRWRQEKGQYPQSLDELASAGFLKELSKDPYSDKSFIYKKKDDDFILYSVGFNFTDDGGQYSKDRYGDIRKWGDNGDTIFWPVIE